MVPTADGPATDLDRLHLTLRPAPLTTPEEFRMFYRRKVNEVRGDDTVGRLSLKLQQSYQTLPFKAFLMGHSGVGKSTEITRLLERVKDQQRGVRLSIATELNPASFKIFDVLLLMLSRLAEDASELSGDLPPDLFAEIERWFGSEQVKKTTTALAGAGVEVGASAKWQLLLGLFATGRAEAKYSAERKDETIEYHLRRLPELVNLCNHLIDVCNQRLLEECGQEWVVVVEDLDKTGISSQQLQELFIQFGNVFQDLRVNLIFTIPVWLAYSPEADRLPFERYMIHDTPVFDKKHTAHDDGRAAVQDVLTARVAPALFAEGQMTRLIVASGGNLRDLFSLVLDAGEGARLRDRGAMAIGPSDASAAIAKMRRDYRMRLGESPYDVHPIPFPEKSARLRAVYDRAPDHEIPDPVLYSLLRARAVQEFNGDGWFGVHPLVVDLLKEQKHLEPQSPGGTV